MSYYQDIFATFRHIWQPCPKWANASQQSLAISLMEAHYRLQTSFRNKTP